MTFKTKKLILFLIGVAFIVLLFAFNRFFLNTLLGNGAFLLLVAGYVAINLFWWRCKNCKKYLGKLSIFATHCPFCGKELE